ncbi:hypothetical protein POM88_002521 [Heracleum sosnowskyi]|uniref:Uncharacterized protein n=1 Tax=Heracleum sosnowskyi TaxID=360622 RepID=A0AAD8NC21_9APIA|nr:hypothetical protein POM88_002521 [Heracleum sosnowskyi]
MKNASSEFETWFTQGSRLLRVHRPNQIYRQKKKIKKSQASLKTKRVRPATDDPVSVDDLSPGSTSKTVRPSKRKTTQKSKAPVKEKRPNLAIHDDPIPVAENGSTLDPLPHLNEAAANVGNWNPWPQSTQNVADKDLEIGHVDEDVQDEGENLEDGEGENLEDEGDNLENAFDNVVVGNEFGNEGGNEVGNQVAEDGHEVAQGGTGVSDVAVKDSEDATMIEKELVDLDRTVKIVAMINDDNDDGVHNYCDGTDEHLELLPHSVLESRELATGLGVLTIVDIDMNSSIFYQMSARAIYNDLGLVLQVASAAPIEENPTLLYVFTMSSGTSALTPQDKVTPAVAKRSLKIPAYLKTPFMRHVGSSSGKSGEGLQNLKDDNIRQLPSLKISTGFTSWLDDGMNTKKKYVFLFVISVQAPQGHSS